jgi:hypothetical protein
MCWYSAEHVKTLQAEAGQRITTRKMYGSTNWMVRECDVAERRPTPVCLLDGTEVLLRPNEDEQKQLKIEPDARAIFRMRSRPKRDVLVLMDDRELPINSLPSGLTLDILMIPGSEQLSKVLEARAANSRSEQMEVFEEPEPEPILARFWRLF